MRKTERKQMLLEKKIDLLEQYQLEICKLVVRDSPHLKKLKATRFSLKLRRYIIKTIRPFDEKMVRYRRYNKFRSWLFR